VVFRLQIKPNLQYVLKADLERCFDRIDHASLLAKLDTFPRLRRLINSWLKAGIREGESMNPSKAGTPQGGPASPWLANVWQPTVVRYADDALILHRDLGTLMARHDRAEGWLQHVGLRFKPCKTRISHPMHAHQGKAGCHFLGFNVRQYRVGRHRNP
jgi:RNA-directed DNA polymerase